MHALCKLILDKFEQKTRIIVSVIRVFLSYTVLRYP